MKKALVDSDKAIQAILDKLTLLSCHELEDYQKLTHILKGDLGDRVLKLPNDRYAFLALEQIERASSIYSHGRIIKKGENGKYVLTEETLGFKLSGKRVEELVHYEGPNLLELINDLHNGNMTLAIDNLENIIHTLLHEAQALHHENKLHLDIKPENIKISPPDYRSHLIDKPQDLTLNTDSVRVINSKAKTSQGYISPEILFGEADSYNVKSDIYSLGMTILQLLVCFNKQNQDKQNKLMPFYNLVCLMISSNQDERPDIDACIRTLEDNKDKLEIKFDPRVISSINNQILDLLHKVTETIPLREEFANLILLFRNNLSTLDILRNMKTHLCLADYFNHEHIDVIRRYYLNLNVLNRKYVDNDEELKVEQLDIESIYINMVSLALSKFALDQQRKNELSIAYERLNFILRSPERLTTILNNLINSIPFNPKESSLMSWKKEALNILATAVPTLALPRNEKALDEEVKQLKNKNYELSQRAISDIDRCLEPSKSITTSNFNLLSRSFDDKNPKLKPTPHPQSLHATPPRFASPYSLFNLPSLKDLKMESSNEKRQKP